LASRIRNDLVEELRALEDVLSSSSGLFDSFADNVPESLDAFFERAAVLIFDLGHRDHRRCRRVVEACDVTFLTRVGQSNGQCVDRVTIKSGELGVSVDEEVFGNGRIEIPSLLNRQLVQAVDNDDQVTVAILAERENGLADHVVGLIVAENFAKPASRPIVFRSTSWPSRSLISAQRCLK